MIRSELHCYIVAVTKSVIKANSDLEAQEAVRSGTSDKRVIVDS